MSDIRAGDRERERTATDLGQALAQGRLQSVILEYDAGVVLLNAVGEGAMLAIVLGDPAVLGKVRYHVKKALPDLIRAV